VISIRNKRQLIENGQTKKERTLREGVLSSIESGIVAVDPRTVLERNFVLDGDVLKIKDRCFELNRFQNIFVLGAGKASGALAESVEGILSERIRGGTVNILEGTRSSYHVKKIDLVETSHPIPGEAGVEGAEKIMETARQARERDLIIFVLSGGGSALLPLPAVGVSLGEIKELTGTLLKSGATINEINTVRKHLSSIKGGQFARAAYPATVIGLTISDVVGDPLDMIASGPAVPDPTTFHDAKSILLKYGLWKRIPSSIGAYIQKGLDGLVEDTPKPGDKIFKKGSTFVVGNNRIALQAIEKKSRSLGFNTMILSTYIEGEARHIGTVLASVAREIFYFNKPVEKPAFIIAGGETTVTVVGSGSGGRNQELALSSAFRIQGLEGIVIASVGTDGIDGYSKAAGGIVDSNTFDIALQNRLDPREFLANNDSGGFFEVISDSILTGPTGTNVNDVMVVAVS
jgi:glycerate-2-kinase